MASLGLRTIPAKINQRQIASLHSSFLAASSQFRSYNFREYFIRRSNQKFQQELPALLGAKHIDDHTLNAADVPRLQDWWRRSVEELGVLERASVMNQLFEGPKLVVEGASLQVNPEPSDNPSGNPAQSHPK